jgi:hypothetical protein
MSFVVSHPFRIVREKDGARGWTGASRYVVSHPFHKEREMDGARGMSRYRIGLKCNCRFFDSFRKAGLAQNDGVYTLNSPGSTAPALPSTTCEKAAALSGASGPM